MTVSIDNYLTERLAELTDKYDRDDARNSEQVRKELFVWALKQQISSLEDNPSGDPESLSENDIEKEQERLKEQFSTGNSGGNVFTGYDKHSTTSSTEKVRKEELSEDEDNLTETEKIQQDLKTRRLSA
jgi:hypothetical protein